MFALAWLRTALGSLSVGDDIAYISSARASNDVLASSENDSVPVDKDTCALATRTCATARVSAIRSSFTSFAGAARVGAASHREVARREASRGRFQCVLNGGIGNSGRCGQAGACRWRVYGTWELVCFKGI